MRTLPAQHNAVDRLKIIRHGAAGIADARMVVGFLSRVKLEKFGHYLVQLACDGKNVSYGYKSDYLLFIDDRESPHLARDHYMSRLIYGGVRINRDKRSAHDLTDEDLTRLLIACNYLACKIFFRDYTLRDVVLQNYAAARSYFAHPLRYFVDSRVRTYGNGGVLNNLLDRSIPLYYT